MPKRVNIVKSVLHAFSVRAERGVSGAYSSRSGDTAGNPKAILDNSNSTILFNHIKAFYRPNETVR